MPEYVNEHYETFKTKGFLEELVFGYFNDQPTPSNYYNVLNYDDDNDNIISGTTVEDDITDNQGLEDVGVPHDEYRNSEIIIDDDDRLASKIDPPPPKKRNSGN